MANLFFSFFFLYFLKFGIFNATFSLISGKISHFYGSHSTINPSQKKIFSLFFLLYKLSRTVCKNVLFATVERLDGAKLARICITTRETISYGRRIVYGITAAFVHLAIYPHEYDTAFLDCYVNALFHKEREICTSRSFSRKRFYFHRKKIP